MAKASNLIGQRFGKLVVVERTENNRKGNTMWKCQCDCGKTKIALGYDLTHGRTVSCGCNLSGKPANNRKDLTGMKFNRLTALKINEERSGKGQIYWDCVCDCGNTSVVKSTNLMNGHVKSCGCLAKENIKKIIHKRQFIDKIGKRYNNFIVLEQVPSEDGKVLWKCRCDCGREFVLGNRQIFRKKSCGCMNTNNINNPYSDITFFVDSGMISRKTYNRLKQEWNSMRTRCRENYHDSHVYFYRGITVCEEWSSFRAFALWALANGYADNLTLDRIDNDKSYSPDNCRWATWKTQQNNKRNNAWITYQGKTQTLKQWSDELNLSYSMLRGRYKNGWKVPMLFSEKRKNQYV